MTPEERLDTQLRELVELAALVNSTLDPREIRRSAVEASTRLVGAERASLLLLESRRKQLYFEVALGDETDTLKRVRMVPGEGIAGSVLATCTPEIIADVQADARHLGLADTDTGYVTRTMLAIPLSCHGEPVGVLEIINKRGGHFTAADLELGVALGNHIAVAVENARLYERLRKGYLEAWVYAALLAALLVGLGGWLLAVTS
ncbi:MAG: GAF domain-containing protein [Coriobacteriia bacterium]|nr:GAF domain-containing protein [Coriobacteriia bacterium]